MYIDSEMVFFFSLNPYCGYYPKKVHNSLNKVLSGGINHSLFIVKADRNQVLIKRGNEIFHFVSTSVFCFCHHVLLLLLDFPHSSLLLVQVTQCGYDRKLITGNAGLIIRFRAEDFSSSRNSGRTYF